MKKILLPEKSESIQYYRANLHCHTTVSDGKKTPEEMKEFYRSHGYSIVAFTDHDAYITHNDLTDDSFLALNGYEVEINDTHIEGWNYTRTCHMCFIAKDKNNDIPACYHRTKYLWGNAATYRDKMHIDESQPDYERVYSPEGINDMIARAQKAGFFVTYNHPTWSMEHYPEYSQYRGMDAMEIVNFGCVIEGFDDDNGHQYEDMLRCNGPLFCTATDDNHNWSPDDSGKCDSFGGYVMLASPKLEYAEIIKALESGMFYASSGTSTHIGPEILSLTYEDGLVTIKTTPANRICYMPESRGCQSVAAIEGETVCEAQFRVAENEKWFRLTVIDTAGAKAYTNAYFPAQLNQ